MGHTAFKCPKAPAQRKSPPGAKSVKALEDQAPPVVNFYVLESAGLEPAHRLRGAKRLRRRQDVCCANAFSALDSTDPDDDDDDQHSDDPLQIVDASDEEVREILKRSESGSPSDEESKAEPACGACEDDFYAGFRCAGASCTHHSTTQGGLNADRPETCGSEPQLLTVECNLLFDVEGFHIFPEPNQPEFIDVGVASTVVWLSMRRAG